MVHETVLSFFGLFPILYGNFCEAGTSGFFELELTDRQDYAAAANLFDQ